MHNVVLGIKLATVTTRNGTLSSKHTRFKKSKRQRKLPLDSKFNQRHDTPTTKTIYLA